jgi:hypothetical protein
MDGTAELHVKQRKPSSKNQRSHVFSHMWMLDLQGKCIYRRYMIATYIYILYMYIYSERENKVILLCPSEGTMGSGKGKENVRE